MTRPWARVLALPWVLLGVTAAALTIAIRERRRPGRRLPAVLRWSPLLGAGILILLWGLAVS